MLDISKLQAGALKREDKIYQVIYNLINNAINCRFGCQKVFCKNQKVKCTKYVKQTFICVFSCKEQCKCLRNIFCAFCHYYEIRKSLLSGLRTLIDRNIFPAFTDILISRTHDLAIVCDLFETVCAPAGDTCDCKNRCI